MHRARGPPIVDQINVDRNNVDESGSESQTGAVSMNLEDLSMATYFRHFTDEVASSPLYAALCPLLGASPIVSGLWNEARPTQRRPNLILAAIHASLLRDSSHELGRWFATVGGDRSPRDPALAAALDSFLRDRHDELTTLIAQGATQTNEVGRSAILRPALAHIHREVQAPLGLVEIGCSAALNLRFDSYRVNYRHTDETIGVGPVPSTVQILADVSRSREPLPIEAMEATVIGSRRGGDLNPLDPTDETQARWLRSLIWPDERERFARLSNALVLAPTVPVDVTQGDAVELVGALIDSVPADQHVVLLTTWVMTYLPEDRRVAFTQEVTRAAATRPISWVCVEHPYYCPGLPWPDGFDSTWTAVDGPAGSGPSMLGNPVVIHRLGDQELSQPTSISSRWVATVHPHGRWVNWHPTSGTLE